MYSISACLVHPWFLASFGYLLWNGDTMDWSKLVSTDVLAIILSSTDLAEFFIHAWACRTTILPLHYITISTPRYNITAIYRETYKLTSTLISAHVPQRRCLRKNDVVERVRQQVLRHFHSQMFKYAEKVSWIRQRHIIQQMVKVWYFFTGRKVFPSLL